MKSKKIIDYLNSQWPPSVLTIGGKAKDYNIKNQTLEMTFNAKPIFCHSKDIVQGGYISGMLDAVMAYTVIGLPTAKVMVSTLELKVSFISAGHPGLLTAKGKIIHLGRSIGFLSGELFQNEKLIAMGTSTVKILYDEKKISIY
jgi:uncharacterized protein (TIGR00369 family)